MKGPGISSVAVPFYSNKQYLYYISARMRFGSNTVLTSLRDLLATTEALGINPRYIVEDTKLEKTHGGG
jgi:hypothetical protein